jgi:hypothetical protein
MILGVHHIGVGSGLRRLKSSFGVMALIGCMTASHGVVTRINLIGLLRGSTHNVVTPWLAQRVQLTPSLNIMEHGLLILDSEYRGY